MHKDRPERERSVPYYGFAGLVLSVRSYSVHELSQGGSLLLFTKEAPSCCSLPATWAH